MSKREEHENYLLKSILSQSISSENPSEEAIKNAYKSSSSYYNRFKINLLNQYSNKTLKDIPGAKEISTDSGDTLEIKRSEKINFKLENNQIKDKLNHNLKLLPRIGPAKEKKLKNNGFLTLESLIDHETYSKLAEETFNKIQNFNIHDIFDLLNRNKYTKECKNNPLRCASLIEPENFKFMDIETLGLSNVPIILIGVAEIKNNKIISNQYFLRDKIEEPAVLDGYMSHLDENSVHVTYNGASFDLPYIRNRCAYYRMDNNLDLPHYDLMHYARNIWSDKLPNCKLQTIEEEIFSIKREDDVPGQFIPSYYETYLEEKNIGPLIPIIDHNCQDVISLASFLMKMYDEVNY